MSSFLFLRACRTSLRCPAHRTLHSLARHNPSRPDVGSLSSRRHQSSATAAAEAPPKLAPAVEEDVDAVSENEPEGALSSSSSPPAESQADADSSSSLPVLSKEELLAEEKPTFRSLKGRLSYPTLKALTVKPFALEHMTPIQDAVLSLLPGLVRSPKLTQPQDKDAVEVEDSEEEMERQLTPSAHNHSDSDNDGACDILARAKTGTGKTFAFVIPAIEHRLNAIEHHAKQAVRDAGFVTEKHLAGRVRRQFTREHAGALIISPTRELATQIANTALRLTQHHKDFEVRLFYGGGSKRMQMRDWMKGRRDIVVGTPGRLRDLIENEPDFKHGIEKCKMLILDEADTLLDMGFRDDLDAIISALAPPSERQTLLFSATISRGVRQVARNFLKPDHKFIDVVPASDSPVHAHVPQYHTVLPSAAEQIPHLMRVLAHDQLTHPGRSKTIVFLPTTKMTQLFASTVRRIAKDVLPAGERTNVYEIHSKLQQRERSKTSDLFRSDKSGASVLITSDVSARGVDYPGVTRVVQVGMPGSPDQYVHRVGRTGRQGAAEGVVGRGDLVLLPWEIGFVTWQLTEVPMRPVTSAEMARQVEDMARAFDDDPDTAAKFFGHVKAGRPQQYIRKERGGEREPHGRLAPQAYPAAAHPRIERENLLTRIARAQADADPQDAREAFASLLGYYVPKSHELRVQKGNVVEGLKDWAVAAGGLEAPPFVSEAFLQRVGFSDGRTKHFNSSDDSRSKARKGGSRFGSSSTSGGYGGGGDKKPPHWMGRGRQAIRDGRESEGPRHQDAEIAPYSSSRGGNRDRDGYGYQNDSGSDDRMRLRDDPSSYRGERYGSANTNTSRERYGNSSRPPRAPYSGGGGNASRAPYSGGGGNASRAPYSGGGSAPRRDEVKDRYAGDGRTRRFDVRGAYGANSATGGRMQRRGGGDDGGDF
ncbi:DEAD-domain-containing protein [Coniophora puteana RWD-64-598 SS2]|uniref:ATP-dependent RNA helicase n=1 Tax=Coniophora puteana (strain RWD-64-598) TaxID=741705 RepID=A0A5M3MD95_CONPW|nr:DEAD-domain-containing protein [Coniophora puteana RWD-64-598 SS2]EIW76997.1 DEAD-domain-containing protein [Coniophora puteana RWD-64-598 SS2]